MSEWLLLLGDARETLATLPAASVQTCVTSPPYWGLRDYGHAGQLGLEATPDEYVANLVSVFAGVRSVLKDDGTLWLNLGDSYANTGNAGQDFSASKVGYGGTGRGTVGGQPVKAIPVGLKQKDLVGIPWMVAFALRADGWYLRSDIIWAKPNPMPESVTDRPTKAHEYLFLLTKSARYYYDAAAIRDRAVGVRGGAPVKIHDAAAQGRHGGSSALNKPWDGADERNKRSVWTVATQPYPEAHFATYPEDLITPCVLAGTSEKGECPACGKAWERITGRDEQPQAYEDRKYDRSDPKFATKRNMGARYQAQLDANPVKTLGWQPVCACNAGDPVPQTVLDPFTGSGTTGAVAVRHQRSFVGCELNAAYLELARTRIGNVAPMFANEATA